MHPVMSILTIAVGVGATVQLAAAQPTTAPTTAPAAVPTTAPTAQTAPASDELLQPIGTPARTRVRATSTANLNPDPAAASETVSQLFLPPAFRATSSLVTITVGDLPIIISAPHGGSLSVPNVPERSNTSVPQFETVTDGRTQEIATRVIATLNTLMGAKPYGVVARFDRSYIDANRPASGGYEVDAAKLTYWTYHQALQRACDEVTRKFGRGILIDLHGQGVSAGVIYRGTRTGLTVGHILDDFGRDGLLGPKSVIGQMQARGYSFLPEPTQTGLGTETILNGGHIVFAYGAQNQSHIDAIQFEMGSTARATANVNKTGDDIAASVAAFVRSYNYLRPNSQQIDPKD